MANDPPASTSKSAVSRKIKRGAPPLDSLPIKYAFIKRIFDGRRDTILIEAIRQYKPQHVKDFDKERVFEVDSFPREEGSLPYNAFILLLEVSKEDLEKRKKSKRIADPVVHHDDKDFERKKRDEARNTSKSCKEDEIDPNHENEQ